MILSRIIRQSLLTKVAVLTVALLLALAACTDDGADPTREPTAAPATATPATAPAPQATATPAPSDPIHVVTTSNIVADWVTNVGGDHVNVFSVLPVGADPHGYQPGARDVAQIADAELVLSIGLSLEASWLTELLENAARDPSTIVELGESIDPIEFAETHIEDVELIEDLAHVIHEVEDGEISPEEGLEEIEELVKAFEAMDEEGHMEHEDEHEGEHHDEVGPGRLLVADAQEAHLSVIDLSTDEVDSGLFDVAAPGAAVYPSPTHRYGIVLARGPEDGDDRIHVFDGGIFLVEHGDHFDLVTQPVSRHSLEIAEELPIHYVNSHGWTAIFADDHGHVFMINEEELTTTQGDYEPIVLEAGPQHGAALAISDEHVVVTTKNPDYPDNSDDSLPVGVEVRDFSDQIVYDASNRSCPGMHGESHNEHGAAFGCIGGVLFLEAHDGEYEHEFIANPPEMREDSRVGVVYGHHDVEHFFGHAFYFDGQSFADDGIWLVDVEHGEMSQVFSEPSASSKFSSDGELFYVLGADGILHALDAHDGDLVATMDLVEPGEVGSPAMIVVGEWLYVSDPNAGHVLGVHLEHMEIEEEWEVGGAPSSLAYVGLTAEGDEHEEHGHEEDEHGHEEEEEEHAHEEDEHGHDHGDEDLPAMVLEIIHEVEDGHMSAADAIEAIHHMAEEGEDAHAGHGHGIEDPHFWFDPLRVKIAVDEIVSQLSALDPDNADTFAANASAYKEQLDELHAWTESQVAVVPEDHRLLVTSHDSLGYFALLYGFEVAGVILSITTEVEPSAADLVKLAETIKDLGVPAVFGETTVSERLAASLATETGAQLVRLYSGSLGQEGSGAETYIGMVRTNVTRITEALK